MADNDLKQFSEEFSHHYDVNKDVVYGSLDHYDFVISRYNNNYMITMSITSEQPEDIENLKRFIELYPQNEPNIYSIDYQSNTVTAILKKLEYSNIPAFHSFLTDMVTFFNTNHLINVCKICGLDTKLIPCSIHGNVHKICEECFDKYKQKDTIKVKENVFLGVVGALIGSIIGAILWIALYLLGNQLYILGIAGIAGPIIFFLAVKGYELLGKNFDKTGIIICVVFTIITIFITEQLCLLIETYLAFGLPLFDPSLDWFSTIIDNWASPDFNQYLIKDLVIGYLLFFLFSIFKIKNTLKLINSTTDIIRL